MGSSLVLADRNGGQQMSAFQKNYMIWEQIQALHVDGFEIGNHTRKHAGLTKQMPKTFAAPS
jgi:hypothetical protein